MSSSTHISTLSTLSAEENATALLRKFDPDSGPPFSHTPTSDNVLEENSPIPGFDIVIETTGAEPCVQMDIHVLRAGGSYIRTGNGKRSVEFPIAMVAEKEATVRGCFRYGPGGFSLGVKMAREGRVPVKRFLTKLVEAWETTRRGEGVKTLIKGVNG